MEISQVLNKIINNNQKTFIHFGVVTALTTSPSRISLKVSGATTAITGVRYLASYTPTVADIVVCLFYENDIIVLGELV